MRWGTFGMGVSGLQRSMLAHQPQDKSPPPYFFLIFFFFAFAFLQSAASGCWDISPLFLVPGSSDDTNLEPAPGRPAFSSGPRAVWHILEMSLLQYPEDSPNQPTNQRHKIKVTRGGESPKGAFFTTWPGGAGADGSLRGRTRNGTRNGPAHGKSAPQEESQHTASQDDSRTPRTLAQHSSPREKLPQVRTTPRFPLWESQAPPNTQLQLLLWSQRIPAFSVKETRM